MKLRLWAAYAGNGLDICPPVLLPDFSQSVLGKIVGETVQRFGEAAYRIGFAASTVAPFVGGAAISAGTGGRRWAVLRRADGEGAGAGGRQPGAAGTADIWRRVFLTAGVPVARDARMTLAGRDWQVTADTTVGLNNMGQLGARAPPKSGFA